MEGAGAAERPARRDFRSILWHGAVLAIAAIVVAKSIGLIVPWLEPGAYHADYSVFWTAVRMAVEDPQRLYDSSAVTQAQAWLTDPHWGPRPFAYPPSALPLFGAFAWLPYWPSLLAWSAVSLACFVWATTRFTAGWGVALVLASPPVIVSLLLGQTALLCGAGILGAVALLPKRPIVSGLLLGLVAAVKPQALLLAPLALVRAGEWRALSAALAAGAAMAAASLAFGPSLWLNWLQAFDEFNAAVEATQLYYVGLSPASFARALGLPPAARFAVQLIGVAIGVALVWQAFRRDDLLLRAASLIGGSILCSPYAMPYELAMLTPVAAAALLSSRRWGLLGAFVLLGARGMIPILALLVGLVMDRRPTSDMVNRPFSRG